VRAGRVKWKEGKMAPREGRETSERPSTLSETNIGARPATAPAAAPAACPISTG